MYDRFKEYGGPVTDTYNVRASTGSTVGTYTRGIDYRSMSGKNTPGFYKARREGLLLPITPFKQDEHVSTCSYYHDIQQASTGYWQTWNGARIRNPEITDAELASVETDAATMLQVAAAKLNSSISHDTLTFLAELRKTRDLLAKGLTQLRGLSRIGNLSDLWLDYRYGYRLMYYDIVDISQALSRLDDARKRFKQRAGRRRTQTSSSTEQDALVAGATILCDIITTTNIEVNEWGNVIADIEIPPFSFQPIKTAWELIPFSFVVDWFIGVGQSLDAITAIYLSSNHVSSEGIFIDYRKQIVIDNARPVSSDWSGTVTYTASAERKLTVRTPKAVNLRPLWNVRLDTAKVLDLIALVFGQSSTTTLRV